MPTSNEAIFDAAVRHQVNLQRLSAGEAKKIIAMLDKSDKELASLIEARAPGLTLDFTSKRWVAMRSEIARTRSAVIRSVGGDITDTLQDLAILEQDIAKAALKAAVPVEVNFATTAPAQLRAMAEDKPFGGANTMQTIGEWVADLGDLDQRRITGALQAGVTNGETIPQITRRIEQATDLTKQNAEAISRTGINHISNSAREEFFKENDDVIQALRWTSTLDGRTSAICRARDGHFTPIEGTEGKNIPSPRLQGSPQRPPAHMRCRSLMIAILDSDAVADSMPERPTVRDTRTRRQREIDFRKQAKDKNADWSGMTGDERLDAIRKERRAWSKENIGTVPGETTYDEWLRRQPESFQNDVLGQAKADKFREGLKLDQFVDRQGNELTIDQLKGKTPPASTASSAEREIQKARDLDAKAKRAEGRAEKAAQREKAERKIKEKHEADAKKLRAEQEKLDAKAKVEAKKRKLEAIAKKKAAAKKVAAKKAAAKKIAAKKKSQINQLVELGMTKKDAVKNVESGKFSAMLKKGKAIRQKRIDDLIELGASPSAAKAGAANSASFMKAKKKLEAGKPLAAGKALQTERITELREQYGFTKKDATELVENGQFFDAKAGATNVKKIKDFKQKFGFTEEQGMSAVKLQAKEVAEVLRGKAPVIKSSDFSDLGDKARALKDPNFALTLSKREQDAILGKDRADLLRWAADDHPIINPEDLYDGKGLKSQRDLAQEFPSDIAQKPGSKWSPRKQVEWEEGLSPEERKAFDDWGESSDPVRAAQLGRERRTTGGAANGEESLRLMEEAYERAPKFEGEVWRGTAFDEDKIASIISEGKIETAAFGSSSVDHHTAFSFARDSGQRYGATSVVMKIQQRSGILINRLTGVLTENEVIMAPNKSYRLLDFKQNNVGWWVFELEEI